MGEEQEEEEEEEEHPLTRRAMSARPYRDGGERPDFDVARVVHSLGPGTSRYRPPRHRQAF
jgi:hypothetical protein